MSQFQNIASFEELTDLNRRIHQEIRSLPPADSMTLSTREDHDSDSDSQVRKIVERVCAGVPRETLLRMQNEYFRAGPIEPLFMDPLVTEIIINGADSIWLERSGRLERLPDRFLSELTYRNFVARMSREAGIQASLDYPFADGRWRECRVHLIIPPASGDQAVVTLRRHPASPWTFESLRERSWASAEAIRSLQQLVATHANFLIVGCTGSGKTSVLNACLGEIPAEERTLIIEDTSELCVPNSISSKLLTRKDAHGVLRDIDQGELLRQSLRMRPDRLVMGEVRGGEAKDLLMAFATGHTGCMGTLHADSARQALLRLEMLIQLGAPQWNLHAVRTLIWLSLQAVVVVGRSADGGRRLEGIYRIASLEDVGFLLEKTL
jgi:pilus assembly protein CpaF